jgi:hypothetical protein
MPYTKVNGCIIVFGLLYEQAQMAIGAYMVCGFVVGSKKVFQAGRALF